MLIQELNTPKGTVRLGAKIRINHLNNGNSPIDDSDYDGKEGTVTSFDQIPVEANPGMHGTWGGLAVYATDDFDILSEEEPPIKSTRQTVEDIAAEIAKKKNLYFRVTGPSGLRCEYTMTFYKKDPDKINDTIEKMESRVCGMTITDDVNPKTKERTLYYDTGKKRTEGHICPPGSLGEMSGFNNEQARLTEKIDEIIKFLR